MYCGSKVVIQEAIKHEVTVDESHKIEAWITLGFEALKYENYEDAEQYANRIIESILMNPEAWYIKGCCAKTDQQAKEYWNKSLSYSGNNDHIRKLSSTALNDYKNNTRIKTRTVEVKRKEKIAGILASMKIFVDDKEQFTLSNGESKSFIIEVGSHRITAKVEKIIATINLDINRNRTVYAEPVAHLRSKEIILTTD